MKKISMILSLTALCASLCAAQSADPTAKDYRQVYDLDPAKTAENVKKMTADLQKVPANWKKAPAIYYVVPPFSDIPRLADSYPEDGIACGTIRIIAAKGEIEPASIVIAPQKNADKFTLVPGDLKGKKGGVIPASAFDIKVLKLWYQAGSAWYGYFADCLQRVLIPELLLNDETLIRVNCATKDNYVRYANLDGSSHYQWMSANFMVTNYSYDNQANIALIADAPTLQPVVLNKNEFKQYMLTLKVPANVKDDIYTGSVKLICDGKQIGTAPVSVRVLPFALPQPKSNYDRSKGFYLSLYGSVTRNEEILKNLAEHNSLNPKGFPFINVFEPEAFKRDVALAKKCGINTAPLFAGSEGVGLTSPRNPEGAKLRRLQRLKNIIQKTGEICKKELGHTDFYSYAIDEGDAWAIRAERNAWKIAHDAGGKVMVTSDMLRELIYALDYLVIPGAPAAPRILEKSKFMESNPKAICGWYANPHGGPENPDYFRRTHGYQAYKSNYDVSSNYCWWRNNWNDMATPYEEGLRGIIMVYAGRDKTIDTLVWEGVREGMDDVKYASYLKDLALEAAESKNGDVKLLGRRVLSYLAYVDEERAGLDALRLECINYILRLRKALNKGN